MLFALTLVAALVVVYLYFFDDRFFTEGPDAPACESGPNELACVVEALKLQDFDRVTLYRTINSLLEHGIIHKAMADEKDTFYALCSTHCSAHRHNHRHIHFKCTRCESVSCLPVETSTELNIPGHVVNELRIEATGICASCNE